MTINEQSYFRNGKKDINSYSISFCRDAHRFVCIPLSLTAYIQLIRASKTKITRISLTDFYIHPFQIHCPTERNAYLCNKLKRKDAKTRRIYFEEAKDTELTGATLSRSLLSQKIKLCAFASLRLLLIINY